MDNVAFCFAYEYFKKKERTSKEIKILFEHVPSEFLPFVYPKNKDIVYFGKRPCEKLLNLARPLKIMFGDKISCRLDARYLLWQVGTKTKLVQKKHTIFKKNNKKKIIYL